MTGAAGKQGRSSVNLFAVEPKDFSFSLSISTPSLSPFLSFSLLTHRQGRSFSVSAHTPVGQHHLESTDTKAG